MKSFSPARALTALCLLGHNIFTASAIQLDATQPDQVRAVAKKVAGELVAMYANEGGVISGIPGLLTYPPYYWWEAGAMFGQLIDYWYFTGDDQYNDLVKEGIQFQVGELNNLMPANQSKDEGNDDQLFWAFTVMTAAELGFPDPSPDQPGWLALAQSVMNQLNSRWDPAKCNGGLRWQIYWWAPGYNYKNTAANGGMFQLAARLAKYTGNATYEEWANRAYDWLAQSPLLEKGGKINDGSDTEKNCIDADHTQWTYNYGIMIGGAAYMYNYTNGSDIWGQRLQSFINQTTTFFPADKKSVMVEVCEASQKCNYDQWSFKAYLARWLATAAQLAPFTAAQIMPILQHSAVAAAQSCNDANICGSRWYWDGFDGNQGVGQQMSALSVISANMILQAKAPYSANTGGTSVGNPAAGTGDDNPEVPVEFTDITTGDKAGASILTILVLGLTLGGSWWLIS